MNRTEALRKRCRELLEQQAVAMVVGWRETALGVAQPAFVTTPAQADTLIFDDRCGHNIANYLQKVKHRGKVAVIAKGCDLRSILSLVKERQLDRKQLLILGVGCEGIRENGSLSDSCTTCRYPNPVIFDEMIGERVPEHEPETDRLAEFERLSADERWQQLSQDVSRCIRCYACRQVCPNCYCPVCFVDSNLPQWVGKTPQLSDNMVFHLMRALHMAGRCVECGACARACPMGIDLMKFNRKVARIVRDRFGAVAGTNPDEPVALTAFSPDDKQEFIK